MQREDIISIFNVIEDTYEVKMTNTLAEVWYNALKDFDTKDVQTAVWQYIRTGHYKPKPADIIDLIVNSKVPQQPEEMSAQEAWGIVYKAICNSAYNSIEEFEKMPEMVQKAVGSADNLRYQAIDDGFNLGVAQSNFIRAYNSLLERKKNDYAFRIEAVKRGELSIEQLTQSVMQNLENKLLIDGNIK